MGKEFKKLLSNPAEAFVSPEEIGERFKTVLDNLTIRRTDETDYFSHHIVELPERVELNIYSTGRRDGIFKSLRGGWNVLSESGKLCAVFESKKLLHQASLPTNQPDPHHHSVLAAWAWYDQNKVDVAQQYNPNILSTSFHLPALSLGVLSVS